MVAPPATYRKTTRRPFAPGASSLRAWSLRASNVLGLGLLVLVGGCREESVAPGPEAVLSQFVHVMGGVHGDPVMGEKAVALLWKPARDNLAERARRASALSGRNVALGEMIAPSWFALHLVPDHYETRLDGNWAEVTAVARDGSHVKSRLVEEGGQWRVALELPPLSPIRQRAEALETR